ncbi:N-terminal C2 in EEIG1 and EHBP1 proteins-domain-containing protein [Boletus reticuloceps]|uniref:N-terminal C2 in EEIG1 and EHBP1 proteins-domain-containing protein n=1 Tax=Boletus reticuloceps TaxID=495285 RepID=A0A8I2YWW1_9AGAM|nr:N-terminal C2 in EEIG1 and EHBP1 proteins-domain-containing protein [Boletus reticuloceps]
MTDAARHRSSTIKPPRRPPSPTPTSGIRAHLAHLLPRHTAFTLTLTLHQLHNVPLVHGEFALEWKIKGVTSHSGNGILDKVKARKATAKLCHPSPPAPSIAKGSDTDNASLFDAASTSSSSANDHASTHSHMTRTHPVPIPAVVVSVNHPSPTSMARSVSGVSSIASVGSASSSPSHARFIHDPSSCLSADWSRHQSLADTETLFNGDTSTKAHYSPAKGATPFVKLKEHSVVWGKTLKFVVQMSVSRDNAELGDCLAKFVVMQRVIAGDPDAPRNPRLGAVCLNLAEYVDAGVVTRRYLLRQSKTNATLKLTVHLEHTAGELNYVAPPLPKDEILSGVAGILESSDVYRTRPRASDLYTHGPSDSSSDNEGSDASSIVSGSGVSYGVSSQSHGHDHPTVKKHRRPFEVAKLPTINDPRGTEKLIEALFNPIPVTQPSQLTPFTYLVEVDGEGDGDGNGKHESHRPDPALASHEDQDTRRGAVDPDDDGSLYANSQDERENDSDGAKSVYHSLRSHPSVPGSLRNESSVQSLASKGKIGSRLDENAEETAISTGVQLLGGATERRTWWQKVLSPSTSG